MDYNTICLYIHHLEVDNPINQAAKNCAVEFSWAQFVRQTQTTSQSKMSIIFAFTSWLFLPPVDVQPQSSHVLWDHLRVEVLVSLAQRVAGGNFQASGNLASF